MFACVKKKGGTTFVSTTVAKDNHTFTLHVVDPMTPQELKALHQCDKTQNSEATKAQNIADMSKISLNQSLPRKSGK